MKQNNLRTTIVLCLFGLLPVTWLALLIAPSINGGLAEILQGLTEAFAYPFNIQWQDGSIKTVLIFIAAYILALGIFFSSQRNTRPREEHGSAKWGDAAAVCRKYRDRHFESNKILTTNVRLGLDGKKHRRNLNTLVVGGSGAGKTRFYCKPNLMQCNTSLTPN